MTLILDKAQVGLVCTTGPAGRLIRAVEGPRAEGVTHVIVGLGNGESIGAEPHGAKIRPVSYWQPQLVAVSHFELTPKETTWIAEFARGLEGTPYNYADDVLIGLLQLRGHRSEGFVTGDTAPHWLYERISQTRTLQCAQLADLSYWAAGIGLFEGGRIPGLVMPGDYVDLFKHAGWWPA